MSATVSIRRWTGSSGDPTKTDITSINTRANAEDAHSTAGTSNSILIPEAGSNYSYWVNTRLSVDTISGGTVDNIKWYSDGSNGFGTGVTCVGNSADDYVQATGTPGETGDVLNETNNTELTAAPTDVFGFTSASPKSITGSASTTGDVGQFFVYQMVIGTTAGSGATNQETFTWQYDDTSS
ncbi:MAG: hypothetical protein BWY19_00928 [bacterium ADurb.Bin212]|jgi:hypothetical protein|nr:MAG: hypothetical protein BWY19_00928 [bacterium ADurb.Bin212]